MNSSQTKISIEGTIDSLTLRPVKASDVLTIFNWSNDPETRKQSFNSSPIPYESHQKWFETKLKNVGEGTCIYYILEMNSVPVGAIRLDRIHNSSNNEYLLSYMIGPEYRSMGLSKRMTKSLLDLLKEGSNHSLPIRILAFVKPENTASKKSLLSCGFIYDSPKSNETELVFYFEFND